MRKINELVKRTRLLRVHACIIGYLKEQMPMFMGREKMQARSVKFVHLMWGRFYYLLLLNPHAPFLYL